MRLLLAGASGLIGRALATSLSSTGHEVSRLVRRAASGPEEISWHPDRRELSPDALAGVDAVICLSGAGVGDHRWSDSYRKQIRDSRVDTVATIAQSLARAAHGPQIFLAASAVGYYGENGSAEIDEQAPNGDGFFCDVCRDWEAAAAPAAQAGVRVVHLRSGLVLAPHGGLLARMETLFRLGLGGRLGNGNQYWPWISQADEVAAIQFLLTAGEVAGPVNLTAPTPVTNAEFTKTLAELLHRPAILPVPSIALRLALGGLADETLTSQRVVPAKLVAAGFRFEHADLRSALSTALAG